MKSSLEILVRWLDPEVRDVVERLGLLYSCTWQQDKKQLELLRSFKRLKELSVAFLPCEGSGWMQGVTETECHVEDVKREVRADWEELGKKFPEWKMPVLRVVRERSLLVD